MKRQSFLGWKITCRTRFAALSFLLILVGAIGSTALGADFSGWGKQMEITFSGYTVGREALTNFPALVVLTDGSNGVDLADFETDGADLRFTASDEATVLNYEIDTWNDADSNSWIWVQVDPLTNNTTIYAYWGKAGQTSPSYTTNGSVWSNGFVGVWHMTNAAAVDSTRRGHDGTANGAVTSVVGVVGIGQSGGRIDYISVADHDDFDVGSGDMTWTCWLNRNTEEDYSGIIMKQAYNNYGLRMTQTDQIHFYNSSSTKENFTGPSSGTWVHLGYTHSDSTGKLYQNGGEEASSTLVGALTANTSSLYFGYDPVKEWGVDAIFDEVRISSVRRSADWIWAECMTMASNDVFAVYGTASSLARPDIVNAVATNVLLQTAYLNGNLTSTGAAQTAVSAHWGIADGTTNTSGVDAWNDSATITANASTGTVTYQASSLTSNRVYYSRLSASNSFARVWPTPSETFMTSEVWVEVASHASEIGCSAGLFTVHRHADATNAAFSVDYTVGGTATGGVHYVDNLGGSVTFAEGDASTHVTVTPLNDWYDQNDRTIELTLLEGPYTIGMQSTALMSITNALLGSLTNVWQSLSEGDASVDGNWSLGHTPTIGEVVLLMGADSTADLTWDSAASDRVAGWAQAADYTGTVTFATVYTNYGGTFTNFTISGDCVVSNGTWTHLNDNSDSAAPWLEHSRLCVTVGADFDLSGTALIDVSGRGFHKLQGTGRATSNYETGSHGGYGFGGSAGEPYGSVIQPERCGSGGAWYSGGGAVYLDIGGSLTVGPNAIIMAEGVPDQVSTGAGGSIYIRTGEIHGSGIIEANGGHTDGSWCDGGGGRVAIVLTDSGSDFSDFSEGNIRAWSGTAGQAAGAGTVYLQTGDQADGAGRLVIDNNDTAIANLHYSTLIPDGVDLADFAEVTVSGNAVLAIDGDNPLSFLSLNLSVEGATASYLSIYNDAQVTYPDTLTITNYSLLIDNASGTLTNVVIESGGVLSHSANGSSEAYALSLTLSGDLTVKTGGAIDLLGKGYYTAMGPGGMSGDYHAGSYGGRGYAGGPCYGSILNPDHLGSGGGGNCGGGKARLNVAGTTTVESGAKISANGADYNAGSGGTLHLTTDTLVGAGVIEANGGSAENPRVAGGGGRVAVYLTGSGQTFHSFTNAGGTITAYGNENASTWCDSAAGTVYLQAAGEAGGTGTCIIDNNGLDMFTYTELPPTFSSNATYGTEFEFADDVSAVEFEILDGAWVQVTNGLSIRGLALASDAQFDLNGSTITTAVLTVNGTTYGYGSYTTNDIVDVAVIGSGTIVVAGVEMQVWGDGLEIANRDNSPAVTDDTDYGQVLTSDSLTHTFTITNAGSLALNLTGSPSVVIGGVHSNDFTVTAQPGLTVLVPGQTTTFDVRLVPAAVGSRTGVVSIANNTLHDSPYTFLLKGEGTSLAAPEISVVANGNPIGDGDTSTSVVNDTDFGTLVEQVDTASHTFTIHNTGLADLILSGSPKVTLSGADAGHFSVTTQPDSPVSAGADATFTIRYEPSTDGTHDDATVTIANNDSDEAPFDFKIKGTARLLTHVWTGLGADNLASTSNNWTGGVLPSSSQRIRLDSTSTKDMTWDAGVNGLSDAVGGWVQDNNYSGTVTFATVYTNYGSTFTNFTISGDCVVSNGAWTHVNDNSDSAAPWLEHSRLRVTVDADFDLSGTALIDVSGRGFRALQGPGRATTSYETGSHGGYGFGASAGEPYGSVIQPERCGSGGGWHSGGGSVYLDIGGSLTVGPNATIMAEGDPDQTSTGAGGSVYIKAGEIHGSGIIEANGGHTDGSWRDGGGGRVAIVLTDSGSDFSDFSEGNIRAWSGTAGQAAGAGTVYLQTGDQADGAGRLVIDNNDTAIANLHYSTLIPDGVDLADFAEVTVSGNAVLAIDGDNPLSFLSLNLSVEGATASYLSIYNDAQVTYPDTLTITNYSLLIDNASGTLTNVVIESGGVLSHSANGSSEAYALSLTLSGDLTVKTGGAIDLLGKGYSKRMGPGGMSGDYHAGSYGGRGYGGGPCYGSILNPDHLGSGGEANPGGGKARLNVAGTTTVESGAMISANGVDYNAGSGGTIHLTTDTLVGAGVIEANGGSAANPRVAGGGGRVAVYLTGSGQTFHSFTNAGGTITAYGNENTSLWNDSAAGTVYLQTRGDAAGAGTCIIDNNGLDMLTYTELPPTFSSNITYGTEFEFADDVSGVGFEIRNGAWVQVTNGLSVRLLVLASDAQLDLNGSTVTLKTSLTIDGQTYIEGTFTEADFDEVVDSMSGGQIVIVTSASLFRFM